MTFAELLAMKCKPLKGPQNALARAQIDALLPELPGWNLGPQASDLRKDFKFPDFSKALAFVNALGWIAERENHHPDLENSAGVDARSGFPRTMSAAFRSTTSFARQRPKH